MLSAACVTMPRSTGRSCLPAANRSPSAACAAAMPSPSACVGAAACDEDSFSSACAMARGVGRLVHDRGGAEPARLHVEAVAVLGDEQRLALRVGMCGECLAQRVDRRAAGEIDMHDDERRLRGIPRTAGRRASRRAPRRTERAALAAPRVGSCDRRSRARGRQARHPPARRGVRLCWDVPGICCSAT